MLQTKEFKWNLFTVLLAFVQIISTIIDPSKAIPWTKSFQGAVPANIQSATHKVIYTCSLQDELHPRFEMKKCRIIETYNNNNNNNNNMAHRWRLTLRQTCTITLLQRLVLPLMVVQLYEAWGQSRDVSFARIQRFVLVSIPQNHPPIKSPCPPPASWHIPMISE